MKLHLCCGDIYLDWYLNTDVSGLMVQDCTPEMLEANKTTIDKYFKYPFGTPRRPIIMDEKLDLLDKWRFKANSISEIVMISAFEHFEHISEVPHIVSEAYRVLKPGGVWKFDFPNIKEIVDIYYDLNPEFCSELIYCNHKNKYSEHKWGYSEDSIQFYLFSSDWDLEFKDVVKHDYPMIGCWATKRE